MHCNLPFNGLKNQLNSRNVKLCFEIFIAIDDLFDSVSSYGYVEIDIQYWISNMRRLTWAMTLIFHIFLEKWLFD